MGEGGREEEDIVMLMAVPAFNHEEFTELISGLLPCFTQLFKASFGEKLCFQGSYLLLLDVQHLLVLPSYT